jgi:hypothetical protein
MAKITKLFADLYAAIAWGKSLCDREAVVDLDTAAPGHV